MQKRKRNVLMFLSLFIGGGLIVLMIPYLQNPLQNPKFAPRTPISLPDVPQITEDAPLALHIHLHLDIYIDGTHIQIPNNLGHLPNGRNYAIHTHDYDPGSGIVHVESPDNRIYTLAQIFEVWGYPLTANSLLTYSGKPVTLYVNGNAKQFQTNYPLVSHDEIVIVYGSAPSIIPSSVSFPTGETP
jgi:hypothetical protein